MLRWLNRFRRNRKKEEDVPVVSRRAEYEICVEFEKAYPRHCPVKLRDGDGKSVGPCWYYMSDGKTCPAHGMVK